MQQSHFIFCFLWCFPLTGGEATKAKRQFKVLKYIMRAFMLRRTKALLVESGTLVLPPLTEITVSDSVVEIIFYPFPYTFRC